jgi:prolyl-tRNA editing enzyme YbaK/EbsC (Cys-tRNA(Pro) deacylase)
MKSMRSVDRVRDYFVQRGIDIPIKELPSSTRTAQLAADAVGTTLGSIVKSLVFVADGRTILALVAGDQRADPVKIARLVNVQTARIANADEVRAATSYAIGGVPPVAHPEPTDGQPRETLIDQTLLRFEKVWAAAGAPNAVFEIETKKLIELTQGRVEDIVAAEN